jgi:hypothetical protein
MGPTTKHLGEPGAARYQAPLHELAVVGEDTELRLALVEIESYDIHGGWPPG